MTPERFEEILSLGENIKIEFKRCGDGIKHDTYETVCSFLNRFGGDIFLGVDDNGNILGVPEKAVEDWKKNFINHISNSNAFSPTTYIEPKDFKYKGKSIIHIHVNPSSEVHSYNGVTYDRNGDADVKVTATDKKTLMYIRKQNIYTERNKATGLVEITPDNYEPYPKNPIIANFFRTIGHADRLGSGVRNLFKYAQHYRHSRPEMLELDIFRTTVYYDSLRKAVENQYINQYANQHINPENSPLNAGNPHVNSENPHVNKENPHVNKENLPVNPHVNKENPHVNLDKVDLKIIEELANNPKSTHTSMAEKLGKNRDTIRVHIKKLAETGIISRLGADKNGSWVVNTSLDQIHLQ